MAEQISRQAAYVAAGTAKQRPTMGVGEQKKVVITSPATVTWANGDTIASPILIPKGSRPGPVFVSCADLGTSITLNVGLRDADGTAIDADGLVAALDVASAAVNAWACSGALVKDGAEYVTTEDSYLYATLSGGTPTANAQLRIEATFLFP